MAVPAHLGPFVLRVPPTQPIRTGNVDLYLPPSDRPRPAIVFVHGGPLPGDLRPTPRDWPVYRGYGSLGATRDVVAATVDHRLHDPGDYAQAAGDVAAAIEVVRADPRVDPARIALWFFSGGGLLAAEWLREPPAWLRCVAATYPLMAPLPGWSVDRRFRPVDAVGHAGTLPVVLTRAGRERQPVAETIETFVAAARAAAVRLRIVDVPNGRHGFDALDHCEESRVAVEQAFDAVLATLR